MQHQFEPHTPAYKQRQSEIIGIVVEKQNAGQMPLPAELADKSEQYGEILSRTVAYEKLQFALQADFNEAPHHPVPEQTPAPTADDIYPDRDQEKLSQAIDDQNIEIDLKRRLDQLHDNGIHMAQLALDVVDPALAQDIRSLKSEYNKQRASLDTRFNQSASGTTRLVGTFTGANKRRDTARAKAITSLKREFRSRDKKLREAAKARKKGLQKWLAQEAIQARHADHAALSAALARHGPHKVQRILRDDSELAQVQSIYAKDGTMKKSPIDKLSKNERKALTDFLRAARGKGKPLPPPEATVHFGENATIKPRDPENPKPTLRPDGSTVHAAHKGEYIQQVRSMLQTRIQVEKQRYNFRRRFNDTSDLIKSALAKFKRVVLEKFNAIARNPHTDDKGETDTEQIRPDHSLSGEFRKQTTSPPDQPSRKGPKI